MSSINLLLSIMGLVALAALIGLHYKRLYSVRNALRVTLFNCALFALFDQLAVSRSIWKFSSPSQRYLYDFALEDVFFTAIMTVHLLALHCFLQHRKREQNQ